MNQYISNKLFANGHLAKNNPNPLGPGPGVTWSIVKLIEREKIQVLTNYYFVRVHSLRVGLKEIKSKIL